MSIQSEIERINNNVANTYSALEEMGAEMPTTRNTNNLEGAVRSVNAATPVTSAFDIVTDTLAWDGNTEGLETFDMMGDGSYVYYLVSDNVIALEDLVNGATFELTSPAGDEIEAITLNDFSQMSHDVIASRSVSSVLFVSADNVKMYSGTIPKKGVYFMKSPVYGGVAKVTIQGYTGFNTPIMKECNLPKWYASKEDVGKLQEEKADQTAIPTKTSQLTNDSNFVKKDVTDALSSELESEITAREQAVASLNERLGQQTVCVAEGETQEEAEVWLETKGDTTKLYLMPDGTFWKYMKTTEVVEGGATYTNLLPLAKDTDRTTIYNGKGYKENTKLSGSGGGESTAGTGKEAMCTSGFIFPVVAGDKLRIKGIFPISASNHYVVGYDSSNARTGHDTFVFDNRGANGSLRFTTDSSSGKYTIEDDGTIVYTINTAKLGANFNAIRVCAGMDENTIITLNEEITTGGGTTTVIVEKWASTGHGLIATNYDEVIASLNSIVNAHTEEINALKSGVGTALSDEEKLKAIKTWDAPIYDAHIPVFELTTEKGAVTSAEKTVASVYAKYDALMVRFPSYITKTDLGVCSDGTTHVYRYDFRESEPHRGVTGAKEWSETKTKGIIVSGIHWEWGGIYSLYNALEELAENPKLFDLRRNTHLIVLPVCNPYAVANQSVRNANQVEIHRNFEVDFIYPNETGYIPIGERSHGGTEPLSEIETQYIDNIFKANTDSAFFLTCHSNQQDDVWGTGFTWSSPATYYMCNLHYRLVDKLSKSWMDRFGETLEQGIADYKTEYLADGDTRLGSAYLSTTNGTETKQATKYGIQATNVEVCDTFHVHGTKANPEPALSSFTMSRGAETYINFLLTAFGVYDFKDKEQYYK